MEFSAEKMKTARGEMTLSEAAFALSMAMKRPVSRQVIWNWENGVVRNPNSTYLNALAKIYGVKSEDFFIDVALLGNRKQSARARRAA